MTYCHSFLSCSTGERTPARASLTTERGESATPVRSSTPTVSSCLRRFCLDCLGATSARGAFDCGSQVCPLRPAYPFLGKPMRESFRPPTYTGEPPLVPRRRPSRKLIREQCRQCQPNDRDDCMATDCPLYPYRPWDGPGKAAKRRPSVKQLAQMAAARERSPLMQRSKRCEQKPTTAMGATPDG